MKKQISQSELTEYINQSGLRLVYGYTPICATCALAERFLDIAMEVAPRDLIKVDLNYHENFIETYQINACRHSWLLKMVSWSKHFIVLKVSRTWLNF